MTAHDILTALMCSSGVCSCSAAAGRGSGLTHCPSHPDDKPSLNVTEKDGRVLVHCHGTSEQSAVLDALRERRLWKETDHWGAAPQKRLRTVEATHQYLDERGGLRYEVVRFSPKGFSQRRPDGTGGWIYNLGGVRRLLYRLTDVAAAARQGRRVYVVEGENDADAIIALGLVATTSSGGAGKWRPEYAESLAGAEVVVIADKDAPGRAHAQTVARSCSGKAKRVKLLELPGDEVKDASDFFSAGGTKAALERIADETAPWTPVAEPKSEEPGLAKGTERKSQATELVTLADGVELFHTPDLEPYATVAVDDHAETCALRSRALRRWLSRRYYQVHGKAPAQSAVQDALGVLEGRALYDGPENPVFVRMAEHDGAIHVDLVDDRWRCVEVTAAGWRIVERPPVRFRRTRGMAALPEPITGGDLAELRAFVNVRDGDQFALLVAFIIAALRPHGPFAVLNLTAEQGSGKSTTQRVIRALTDPSTTPVRAEPRDVRDVMIAATNSWVVSFDNVSHLPAWLSDAICRLATGGGFSTRELYTDAEEVLFDAQRPVMMNGIEELAIRGDLLDRSIIVNLPGIPDDRRRTESEFWDEFTRARPRIFGALLTAVAMGLTNLPTTRLARPPRLADMATWVVATEPALPWPAGRFLAAYTGNRADANELALEASPVVAPLLQSLPFTGTATDLLALLVAKVSDDAKRQRAWPKNAVGLSNQLRHLAPNLRAAGVEVEFARDGRKRTVSVCYREGPGEHDGRTSSSASRGSRASESRSENGDGDDAPIDADDGGDDVDGRERAAHVWSGDADDASDAEMRILSRSCRTCGGTDFWTAPGGGRLCASCHPPIGNATYAANDADASSAGNINVAAWPSEYRRWHAETVAYAKTLGMSEEAAQRAATVDIARYLPESEGGFGT